MEMRRHDPYNFEATSSSSADALLICAAKQRMAAVKCRRRSKYIEINVEIEGHAPMFASKKAMIRAFFSNPGLAFSAAPLQGMLGHE